MYVCASCKMTVLFSVVTFSYQIVERVISETLILHKCGKLKVLFDKMVEIAQIEKPIDKCEIVASISTLGEVRTYGESGKYINLELFDGATIKFTLFGNDVDKTIGLQVSVFLYTIYVSNLHLKFNYFAFTFIRLVKPIVSRTFGQNWLIPIFIVSMKKIVNCCRVMISSGPKK